MKTIYCWKDGSRMRGNAQAAGERLERIKAAHRGELKPIHVLTDARSKSSPLHGLFNWNDKAAAEAHRLHQATMLIGSIEIKFDTSRGPMRTRAYVSLHSGKGRDYHDIRDAMSSEQLRAQLLKQAIEEAELWRDRHKRLTELAAIFREISRVAKKRIIA